VAHVTAEAKLGGEALGHPHPGCLRKSGKQRTYKEAFLRFGATDESAKGYPHPGCFAKRGWIFLIIKELTFLGTTKRLQEIEGSRVKGRATGGISEVCSR